MNECIFCREGSEPSISRQFLGKEWPYIDRILHSDQYFYVIAGLGPQVSPYMLIVPYRHLLSLADMNQIELSAFQECLKIISNNTSMNLSLNFFEHGGSSVKGSSSIDHCHIHVIDGSLDFYNNDFFSEYSEITLEKVHSIKTPYFLVGKYYNDRIIMKYEKDNRHEHQYLRKVLASHLRMNTWNWKEDKRMDLMLDTMRCFKEVENK